MKNRMWIGLFVLVITVLLTAPGFADKVVVDPNCLSVKTNIAVDDQPDPRLSKKITYDSGSKRLYVAVEEISRLAGMDIHCGNNKKDWVVRDIPVVICVKDMPLGKLLRAIADATHTWFASERIGDDPQKTYRIYRRHIENARIDSYYEEKRMHALAVASWQWDALVACGMSEKNQGIPRNMRLLGEILGQLGPGVKENVLAGEELVFGAKQAGCGKPLSELQGNLWGDVFQCEDNGGPFIAQDLSNLMLTLELQEDDVRGRADITALLQAFNDSPPYGARGTGIAVKAPRELEKKGLGLSPYPEDVKVPDPQTDMANPAMVWLDPATSSEWDHSILSAKINVKRPEHKDEVVFADAIRAIALASGLNIVVEDFASHFPPRQQNLDSVFTKNASVTECLLSKLRFQGCLGSRKPVVGYNTWFLNEKDNLLIGWADDGVDNRWRDHHKNLLPEDYVNDLKSKIAREGLDVDDAAHLTTLSPRSLDEWVYTCYGTPWVQQVFNLHNPSILWKLYDSLDSNDKLAAKSESGLILAKLDLTLMENFPWQKLSRELYTKGPSSENWLKFKQDVSAAMHDRNVINSMVMRLCKEPAKQHNYYVADGDGYRGYNEPPPSALGLYHYQILINCKIDGENCEFIGGNTPILPIRSPAREAEIMAAAAKENDNR